MEEAMNEINFEETASEWLLAHGLDLALTAGLAQLLADTVDIAREMESGQ